MFEQNSLLDDTQKVEFTLNIAIYYFLNIFKHVEPNTVPTIIESSAPITSVLAT